MPKTIKRKTSKTKPTTKVAKRKRNNVNFILTDQELAEVKDDLAELNGPGRPAIRLGGYAKFALLQYAGICKSEKEMRNRYFDLKEATAANVGSLLAKAENVNAMLTKEAEGRLIDKQIEDADAELARRDRESRAVYEDVSNSHGDGGPTFGSHDHSELGAGDA